MDEVRPWQTCEFSVSEYEWQLVCVIWQLQSPKEVVQLLRETHADKITPEAQLTLVKCLLNNQPQYPPGRSYCSRLLRALALAVEEDRVELVDELADLHAQNLTCSDLQVAAGTKTQNSADGWCYKTYAYNLEHPAVEQPGSSDIPHEQLTVTQDIEGTATDRCFGLVTLKLALNLFEGATGCHEWEAGFLLAEFVFSNARLFKGQSCLELGCGAGVVGVALSRVGAAVVHLTDGNAATVYNCRENLEINRCTSSLDKSMADRQVVEVTQMQWEESCGLQPDIVLAADVLYDPGAIPPLIQQVKSLLTSVRCKSQQKACTGYVATALRNQATLQLFLDHAVDSQLDVEDVSSQARQSCVQFQHHLALRAQRSNIFLHKLASRCVL